MAITMSSERSIKGSITSTEKAVHVVSINGMKYLKDDEYHRVYWGNEFCQNLIPPLEATQKVFERVEKQGLGFTYVTPFVTEHGLQRLRDTFIWFKEANISCEIVINDWGVLQYLKSECDGRFELAFGRLLVRQQRDPSMGHIIRKQLPVAAKGKDGEIRIFVHKVPDKRYQEGVKASYVNSPSFAAFLSTFGINRVELNNLIQGLNVKGITCKKSIYTPFVNISTTRFCPMETTFQKIYRINVCKKECQRYYDILRNRAIPKVIYKRGNTVFYRNPLNAALIQQYDVDRVVYQPELPF
ncbi:MAG: hypothetical protein JW938_01555 [Candidatus Omnitrophica bacterium]|nr:hypothetical protein [Candidatus Omnitrophota bacterium]